jgi:hypothetical protein
MTSLSTRIERLSAEKYESYAPVFGDGLDAFTNEILKGFCMTCAQIEVLNEEIAREGLVIETEKGPKENPKLNIVHKRETDKARAATYLRRVLVDNGSDEPTMADDWS